MILQLDFLLFGLFPLCQDSYLEAAFSEEQLLTVPLVPEGTEYQAQCIFRSSVFEVWNWIKCFFRPCNALTLSFQTPCKEVFGPQKTYLKHRLRKYLED